jgi:hypothetical protein
LPEVSGLVADKKYGGLSNGGDERVANDRQLKCGCWRSFLID